MEELDQNSMDTAITLGDAVCDELEICCDKRGRVIYQLYKQLRELKPAVDTTQISEAPELQPEQNDIV